MKLTGLRALEGVAEALRDQIAPNLTDRFAIEAARQGGSVLMIAALAMDDAVELRVAETARMRALFAQGLALDPPAPLAARLAEAVSGSDPGLKISVLDAEIARLRPMLVDLHAWVEAGRSPEARALDRAIWQALRDFEMARAPRA